MIDYKLLEALALVIEEGGFEKASHKLHITQSAVSQRVKMLEESAGQILVTRTLPPAATEAGLILLSHYRKVKMLEDDISPRTTSTSALLPTTFSIGINADSLATWFLDAVEEVARTHLMILDIQVDDQEQTQKLLQGGHVYACISTYPQQMQGCRIEKLGTVEYGLFCTPLFRQKWFQDGVSLDSIMLPPTIRFNRKDNLNENFFMRLFGSAPPASLPTFYVPSSEKFVEFILKSLCYGIIPAQQSNPLCKRELLIDLAPACKISIELYYHCWNLKSKTIETFNREFLPKARKILML